MLESELATNICLRFTPIYDIWIYLTQNKRTSAKLQSEKMTQNSWKTNMKNKFNC